MTTNSFLKLLSNENRLQILLWILTPKKHFPPQQDGDLVKDGVCISFITEKVGLSQPTVTAHMKALEEAGLVKSKQIKNWVFYRPDRKVIEKEMKQLHSLLLK